MFDEVPHRHAAACDSRERAGAAILVGLVAAGRRFDIDPDTLAAPGLDIVDVHYYPPTAASDANPPITVTRVSSA